MTPPGLEIMPLDWAYEDEDQTIAVRVEDGVGSHAIEDNLLGPMIDDDESHGTCFFAWYGPNTTMRTPGCNFRNYLTRCQHYVSPASGRDGLIGHRYGNDPPANWPYLALAHV